MKKVVKTLALNFRSGPGIDYKIVNSLRKGHVVEVIDDDTGWLPCDIGDGAVAWASERYLEDEGIDMTPYQSKVHKFYMKYKKEIDSIASTYDINPALILAVIFTESSGRGFYKGNLLIRFEVHHFYKWWGKNNTTIYDRHFKVTGTRPWTGHKYRVSTSTNDWKNVHASQYNEMEALLLAAKFDEQAAYSSISMGLPQILGSNCALVGYSDPKSMFDDFNEGEDLQIKAMFKFISSQPNMAKALKAENHIEFARWYNGKGQKHKYGDWIRERQEIIEDIV